MEYQLSLSIDQAGLETIYEADQSVTLVRDVVGLVGAGEENVVTSPLVSSNLPTAWVEFRPLENNSVSWIENYYIYASTTSLQAGATIVQSSVTGAPVQIGWMYTFQNGAFSSAQGGGANTYNLTNEQANSFNFGLAQQAMVNNVPVTAPLNAIPVLYNEQATFTPEETISIFLSSYINNGVVISQVASSALIVTLTSQTPTANIGFNEANNTFYLISLTSATTSARDFARRLRSYRV